MRSIWKFFRPEGNDRTSERGEKLKQKILNPYIGGQVVLYHPEREQLCGVIESISISDTIVEVDCEIVSRKVYCGRKWEILEKHDGFLIIDMETGWRRIGEGAIKISGRKAIMLLFPRKSVPYGRDKIFGE